METFNEKIKRIRKSRGLNQIDVCLKIGITQPSFASIEAGRTKSISIDLGKKLAGALEVSFIELFDIENSDAGDNLQGKIEQVEKRIVELEEQLNDKKELLRYYQQSYTVTERMVIIQADDFHKLCPDVEFSINVGELRNRAMIALQREYPDLFIIKPPFLLRKDSENTNLK